MHSPPHQPHSGSAVHSPHEALAWQYVAHVKPQTCEQGCQLRIEEEGQQSYQGPYRKAILGFFGCVAEKFEAVGRFVIGANLGKNEWSIFLEVAN